MAYNSILVANKIIELTQNMSDKGLSVMKLLKLQYIAHGYSLAILDKPLFDAKIEAWPRGPVIREVYSKFRREGKYIEKVADNNAGTAEEIDDQSMKLIQKTLDSYSDKGAFELSDLTHQYGTPWTQVIEENGFYAEIPNSVIKKYYLSLIS